MKNLIEEVIEKSKDKNGKIDLIEAIILYFEIKKKSKKC